MITIICQILNESKSIKLGSLTPTRDFNYVEDTCMAFLKLSQADSAIGRVVNSASNFEISIEKTALLISELMNRSVEIVSEEKRKRPSTSEVNRLFGSNKKIFSLTNWRQDYGGIDGFKKGLIITIDWFTNPNNLSLYRSDYLI